MQPTTDRGTTAWYLIHTKPRQEHIALTNLERQGYTCYLPLLRVEKIRRRKAEVVSEPMFARYLFVRLSTSDNAPSWAPIRSTLGVSQLVRFGAPGPPRWKTPWLTCCATASWPSPPSHFSTQATPW